MEIKKSNTPSDGFEGVLESVPGWYILYGRLIIFFLFVFSIIICSIIKIPKTLTVTGSLKIKTYFRLDTLTNNDGINEILIKNFQQVKTHQPLFINIDHFKRRDTFYSSINGKIIILNNEPGKFSFEVIPDTISNFFYFSIPIEYSNKFFLGKDLELRLESSDLKKRATIHGIVVEKEDNKNSLLSYIKLKFSNEIIQTQYYKVNDLLVSNLNIKITYERKNVLQYLLNNLLKKW